MREKVRSDQELIGILKERSEKGRNYPANWNSKEGEQRKQKGGNYLRNDTTKEYKFLN